jgi:hypothetical protein
VNEAERELKAELAAIFNELCLLPDAIVENIDNTGFAEDGKTFCVMCATTDGSTLMVSICPGRPVSVQVVD